ncbi:MAG: hypothetical protein J5777_08020 [Clostridiales bacterium]|nr:hypothetical protein [Clostridiales bacterium]
MAFSIKIYEQDKYMYALMKARIGQLYPEAYITDPYLDGKTDNDGDMFGEFTKILYNPKQFGEDFGLEPPEEAVRTLKDCLDRPVPTLDPEGIVDCRNICRALGIEPSQSRDPYLKAEAPARGRLEVLIPFVYIGERENYIKNNYKDMTDADLSIRLDLTSRLRAPEDDGAGIAAGNMTGLLEACVSKRFEPDDILKYCSRNCMGFLTPGATKGDDDVYDLGSTRCRMLLDKCRQLVSDESRKINVLAVTEGFRSAELPVLVSDCDRVTILFSGKDKNEEVAASGLISAISRSLTHGEIVTDFLDPEPVTDNGISGAAV